VRSACLEEVEQQGSKGHKDLTFPIPEKKRAYKTKITEVSVGRRTSAHLKEKERVTMNDSFWNIYIWF
jgi:hypothetical protein